MKLSILAGATSQSVNVFVRDSTSTTGGGLAAVAPAGGSLLTGTKLYYSFSGANASAGVAVSLAVLAAVNSAWSSAGIVTLDGTNMIGWVRIDLPNAIIAAAKGRSVSLLLFGGTNMAPTPFEIELTGWDNQDGVRGGLTALPNAAVSGVGGLLTAPTTANTGLADVTRLLGTAWLTPGTAGTPDVNTKLINGVATTSVTTINANQGTTQPLNFTGTGAGALAKGDTIDWNSVGVTGMPMPTYAQPEGFLAATFPSSVSSLTQTQVTGGAYSIQSASAVLGDARIAHLDADVSSRLATSGYTVPPTVGQIATATWQDTTAGDFTVASSIGKSLYTTGNAPGAASGLSLVGSAMALTSGERTTLAASIWNALTSGFSTAGSIGLKLANWVIGTTQTGDVATVIAKLPTNNIADETLVLAAVGSPMQAYTQPTGFLAATFPATFPTAVQNADAWAGRNAAGGSNGGKTNAYYQQMGPAKVAFDVPTSGQYTVYGADGTTILGTGTYAASAVNPVTALTPA